MNYINGKQSFTMCLPKDSEDPFSLHKIMCKFGYSLIMTGNFGCSIGGIYQLRKDFFTFEGKVYAKGDPGPGFDTDNYSYIFEFDDISEAIEKFRKDAEARLTRKYADKKMSVAKFIKLCKMNPQQGEDFKALIRAEQKKKHPNWCLNATMISSGFKFKVYLNILDSDKHLAPGVRFNSFKLPIVIRGLEAIE